MASSPAGEPGTGAPVPAPRSPSAFRRLFGYVSLAVKLALFALVFALAVKNSDPVTLKFFLGREVETSLALALVAALCAGALFGVLAMTGYVIGLRREASRARDEGAALRRERDALRTERDALRTERDALDSELAARAPGARALSDAAAAGVAMSATDRQVPHGL